MVEYATSKREVLEALRRIQKGQGTITPLSKSEEVDATQNYAREKPRREFIEKVEKEDKNKRRKEKFDEVLKVANKINNRFSRIGNNVFRNFTKGRFLKKPKIKIKSVDPKKVISSMPYSPMTKPTPKITNRTGWFSDEFLNEQRSFDKRWLYADDFGWGL